VNVGGNNRLPMAELRRALAAEGFTDVRTHIASGNVLLGSDGGDTDEATQRIAGVIEAEFGFTCSVLVRSGDDITRIARAIPEHWSNGPDRRSDVLYLFTAVDSPAILERLPAVTGVDEVAYVPGAVLWSIERRNATRSGLVRIVGTDLYRQVTVRNVNTARTLAALVAEHPG
jgi:uncharacterized protein (DUF1697 family)